MADALAGEPDVLQSLRSHFKSRTTPQSCIAIASEVQAGVTLGKGHFGRVRLIKSDLAVSAMREEGIDHSGYFALKIMKKSEVIRLKQVQHIADERKLLKDLKHPFIVTMYHTYQDDRNLYIIAEFVPGGELATQLREKGTFDNDVAKFYAAQVVMSLQYLHSEEVIFRGVSPENLLIDSQGYLKLIDFGFAKKFKPDDEDPNSTKTFTLCGTPEYLAPEMIESKGHYKGVDWWAVGILTHELLAGYPPFYEEEPYKIYKMILKGLDGKRQEVAADGPKDIFPRHMDVNARALIESMLAKDVSKRLGCKKNGAEDIKKHKWFRGLNWANLYNKLLDRDLPQLHADYDGPGGSLVPHLEGDNDTSAFGKYDDSLEESGPLLSGEIQSKWSQWGS